MGYYDTITPPVILRNVMENPGWYFAHALPGRESPRAPGSPAQLFQQMVIDLTGFRLANASLLDEATAAAEAMTMARRMSNQRVEPFFRGRRRLPQTLDVVRTRARILRLRG